MDHWQSPFSQVNLAKDTDQQQTYGCHNYVNDVFRHISLERPRQNVTFLLKFFAIKTSSETVRFAATQRRRERRIGLVKTEVCYMDILLDIRQIPANSSPNIPTHFRRIEHMGFPEMGTPKSSTWMGLSIINHPFLGYPHGRGNPQMSGFVQQFSKPVDLGVPSSRLEKQTVPGWWTSRINDRYEVSDQIWGCSILLI